MRVSRVASLVAAGALALTAVLTGAGSASAAGVGSISGVVYSSNSVPQAGITVSLDDPFTGTPTGRSTTTDSTGQWTLDTVPVGPYAVHYSGPVEGYAPDLTTLVNAATYDVFDGGVQYVYEVLSSVTVPPNYSLTLVGSDGASIPICPRFFPAANPDAGPLGDGCTTTGGVTTGVQTPGSYLVEFLDDGGNYGDTWIGTDGTRATATPVTIPATGVGDFGTVVMPVAAHLTVKVHAGDTGLAIAAGSCVTVFYGRTQEFGSNGCSDGTTDTITVNGLRPGTYSIQAYSQNLDYVDRWSGNAVSAAKAKLVTVASGQTLAVAPITLPVGGVITGRVTDKKTGKGVEGICASTGRWNAGGREDGTRQLDDSCTDADGRYRIRGLDNGTVKIQFVPSIFTSSPTAYALTWYGGSNHDEARSVPTKLGRTVANVDVALSPEGSISGTAADAAGNPIFGQVFADDAETGYPIAVAGDDPGTEFRLGNLPTTTVLVHWDTPTGTRYWDGTRTGTANRAKAVPIRTRAGQAITGLTILVK